MFVLGSVLHGTINAVASNSFNVKQTASVALVASLTYLAKNLGSNSSGEFLQDEQQQ